MFENVNWPYVGPLCLFTILALTVLVLMISYRFWSFYSNVKSYNANVVVKTSTLKDAGKGVFATKSIPNGEIVELCPLIIDETKNVRNGTLRDYLFDGHAFDENSKLGNKLVMALGYGAMYNHSMTANCKYTFDFSNKIMMINATRDINPGEELFIYYGVPYWSTRQCADSSMKKNDNTTNTKENGSSGSE